MSRDNKTIYLILGMLSHEPMTGYDIKKRMEQAISYFWNAGYGQIYPTLSNLEKSNLIAQKASKNSNTRGAKIYTITKKGRTTLKTWLSTPLESEPVRYEILLKLFFSASIPTQKIISNLQKFLSENEKNAETMRAFEENLILHLNESPDHRYFLYTVRFGKKTFNSYCEWARETIEDLKKNLGEK
jgi:DNA-binding PadR family transcriptional regulator